MKPKDAYKILGYGSPTASMLNPWSSSLTKANGGGGNGTDDQMYHKHLRLGGDTPLFFEKKHWGGLC